MASQSQGTSVSFKDLVSLRLQSPLLTPSKKQNNPWVGDQHAKNRGRGMDFEGVRIYQPGDDVRVMDWKVTARTHKPQIKIYNEERERPLYIILDLCESMHFGTRVAFKSVIASMLAAMLSWRAYAHGDRVGGIVFNDNERRVSHPLPHQRGVLRFIKHVVDVANNRAEMKGEDCLSAHLTLLRRLLKPGGGVILISDFYRFSESAMKQLQHLSTRQQVESFFIYDPFETQLPDAGYCQFVHHGRRVNIDTLNKQLKAYYHEQFVEKLSGLTQWHYQRGMGFCSVATNDNLQQVLKNIGASQRVK